MANRMDEHQDRDWVDPMDRAFGAGLEALEIVNMLSDVLCNWKDAGRWGAGLVRRAISIAMLFHILAIQRLSSLMQISSLRERCLPDDLAERHLVYPPGRWAGA